MKKQYKIKDSVLHQNIGGKIFNTLFLITPKEMKKQLESGNIACMNFFIRRDDYTEDFNKDLYYGKVEVKSNIYLGYVLCEDELEEIKSEENT